ncbi:unnamed protein product [Auanema sp. JU1783]|nr:unnamed protein product [Auanema sp. JU1783]
MIILFLVFSVTALPPHPQDYPAHVTFRCPFNQFDCDPTSFIPTCISFSLVRNCIKDCPNGADELCGRGQIFCDQGTEHFQCGQCVPAQDQLQACYDRKWQKLCSKDDSVRCLSTVNCVLQEWLSDGKDDCGDGSDEDPCTTGIINCQTDSSNITLETTTTVPTNKTATIPKSCELGQFRCQSGECIDSAEVLDEKKDCIDGSDENYCEHFGNECVAELRPCSYHPDIATFSCGCPKGHNRNHKGVCAKHNKT